MMVRAAVLKMKDPRQIIRDMEKLDEMGKDEIEMMLNYFFFLCTYIIKRAFIITNVFIYSFNLCSHQNSTQSSNPC